MLVNNEARSPTFLEEQRELPLLDQAEVVVLGGGPGGVAAAIAAARTGARTILVERFGSLGGTWTSGLLSSIMPFPYVSGIFPEILQNLDAVDGWRRAATEDPYDLLSPSVDQVADCAGFGGTYDAEKMKVVLDQMVLRAGVRPYFFLQVASVMREGDSITGIVVESKEGRGVITGSYYIDSSGDGDVAHLAKVPTSYGRDGDRGVQPMTMIFTMDGVDDAVAEEQCAKDHRLTNVWQQARKAGEVTVPRENVLLSRMPVKGQWAFNTTRIIGKDGTRIKDISEAMIEGRRQVNEVADFLRRRVPGFAHARVSSTASHIGVRETRRVSCDYTITGEDITTGATFPDGIARGNWYIDIHNPTGEGTEIQSPPPGHFYEIPYRSLRARGLDNLLIASRCIDCTHEAHAAIRITPQVVAIGQAAGTAAGLCVAENLPSSRLLRSDVLRQRLRQDGAFV
jgi:hypothetical protein